MFDKTKIAQEINEFEKSSIDTFFIFDAINLKKLLLESYNIKILEKLLTSSSLLTQCHIFHALVLKKEKLLYKILIKLLKKHKGKRIMYHYLYTSNTNEILVNQYFFDISKPLLTKRQEDYIIKTYFPRNQVWDLSENSNKFIRVVFEKTFGHIT